ncbi:MAG TPA: TonB-dependent receptor [Terriglobales bacterium]|nr:TonB-dependent receptor [Terriglobales bacterium]
MQKLFLAFTAICLLTFSAQAFAQTPDTATVRGTITDFSGAAVAGVTVTASNQLTGLQRFVTSTSRGEFSLSGLPVTGSYRIHAEHPGFASAEMEHVSLLGGATATIAIQLRPSGGKTEITVRGTSGEVRDDQPQIGTNLSTLQIHETPLLNRRITYLPLLNSANRPAINTGDAFANQNLYTTNGAGRRQTNFVVDGGSGIDLWGRQTIMTNIPADSLQDMTILNNAFSAEYGAGVGSVVNIVTRTGGNSYHGSLLGLYRPAAWGAQLWRGNNAASGVQVRSDDMKQFAANIGGPIGSSGKTHFLLNGEYTWQNRTSPVTAPVAPGNFVGHYRGWLGFARFDHQINSSNTAFVRLSADSFRDTNPGGAVGGNSLPATGRIFRRRTYTAEIGETAVLSSNLINNFRASFALGSPITEFEPIVYSTQVQVPISNSSVSGTFTSGTSQAAKLQNRQFELANTLSLTNGRHTLKFGADIIHAHNGGNSKEFGGPNYLGTLVYKQCTLDTVTCETTYLNSIANVQSYSQSFGNAVYTVDDTLWSLFTQDDIRVTNRLTLNAGLRYERQTFTDATKNFAPRVGFAADLFGDGKTALRGGYGIYYSTIPDNLAANHVLSAPEGVFTFTATAGQVGFPSNVDVVPYASLPSGAAVPVRSLYIRPGMAAYYNQFIPVSALKGYQDSLLNPYSQQWTLGVERELVQHWVLSVDYVGSRTLHINRPLDVNPPTSFLRTAQGQSRSAAAANCTRPTWRLWYAEHGTTCGTNPQPPYSVITSDVNNGYANYNALQANLKHRFSTRLEVLASYTWSHALDNVDPDIPGQNPNDPNFTDSEEYADAIFDQRHRFVLSGVFATPFKFNLGGVMTLGSGLPYNITTGTNNSGDTGATADRPIVDGSVLRRNSGRGDAIFELSPFVERPIRFTENLELKLRAEAFNITNHPNFVGYNSVYGNGAAPPASFGTPATGFTAQLPARSFQFSARLSF